MRHTLFTVPRCVVCAFLALFTFACTDGQPAAPDGQQPLFSTSGGGGTDVSGQYLVMFRGRGVPRGFAGRVEALGGTVTFSHDIGIATVSGLSPAAAARLEKSRNVSEIQPDEVFQLDMITNEDVAAAGSGGVQSPGDPTTAAAYARQWNMRAIEADAAWAAGRTGSSDVTLAILDSGIDYLYPDLAGLVDLSRSISFVPDDDVLVSIFFPGRHPVTDLHFHGTHVASTAVSHSNVIAGVTTQTTLMGVKVCSVYGSCPFSNIIAGVLYAADNGADVANLSLGGLFAKAGAGFYVGFINRVYNYANSVGMTIVVAAGNNAIDMDHDWNVYETYCSAPNVLCVSATGPTAGEGLEGPWTNVDAPAPYSNFGRSAINVAAPGGTVIANSAGWVWGACSQTSLVIPDCQTGIYILGVTGTSMSAPHVSGLAALMVEDFGRNPARVRARIQQSADDLGQPGTDPAYGKGRINVAAAVGG
jgi:subtilisin family serine protease